jgi:hypothetical protein
MYKQKLSEKVFHKYQSDGESKIGRIQSVVFHSFKALCYACICVCILIDMKVREISGQVVSCDYLVSFGDLCVKSTMEKYTNIDTAHKVLIKKL